MISPAQTVRRKVDSRRPRGFGRVKALGLSMVAWFAGSLTAAELPAEWQYIQSFRVPEAGLVRISVPLDTLTAARPGLEDLRLLDSAQREIPYFLEHPSPPNPIERPAQNFRMTVSASTTLVTFETGVTQPVSRVTLQTPAPEFLKAVHLEGSADAMTWTTLARGQPIFRQRNHASQTTLSIPPGPWRFFRLTLDDKRSPPIPVTGVAVRAEGGPPPPGEPVEVRVLQRTDDGGRTRVTLLFGGANFTLALLRLDTPDPLFTRMVTLSVPVFAPSGGAQTESWGAEQEVSERTISRGIIYRVNTDGHAVDEQLTVGAETPIQSREIHLEIQNDDNPPLQITGVQAVRRPVYVTFLAARADDYHLFTGNPRCSAPRYDLAALQARLRDAATLSIVPAARKTNAAYRPSDPLAEIETVGVVLDVSPWRFRKPVTVEEAGVQRLELDLDILARAANDFRDLRLLRAGKQIPYVIERAAVTRRLDPRVEKADDPKRPTHSRWRLILPQHPLPVATLSCASAAPYFQRAVRLYETRQDARGREYQVTLGSTEWSRMPGSKAHPLTLALAAAPVSGALLLEIDNGDNPALELEGFTFSYPATRLLFKSTGGPATQIYYGNATAVAPRYDLRLAGQRLLAAEKSTATLGPEEVLNAGPAVGRLSGQAGWIFWGVLGLVVAGLLAILARLLPKTSRTEPGPASGSDSTKESR